MVILRDLFQFVVLLTFRKDLQSD